MKIKGNSVQRRREAEIVAIQALKEARRSSFLSKRSKPIQVRLRRFYAGPVLTDEFEGLLGFSEILNIRKQITV